MNSNSILIVAGEVSGDIQGGKLVKAIKELSPEIKIAGIGGDNMSSAGMELLRSVDEMSFLGFTEIIKHLPFVRKVMNELLKWIEIERPKIVLLIDYPGFNLRLAEKAKKLGCKIIYYISPQIWAWGKGRIKKIAGVVDQMIVIFPFEEELYRNAGVAVEFVGHPILENLEVNSSKEDFFSENDLDSDEILIGLLPGSRTQEVESLYKTMIDAVELLKSEFPNAQSITAKSPVLDNAVYDKIAGNDRLKQTNKTYDVMKHSDLLFVASGTATLESACFGTPFIVVYRVSPISWFIGKMLVKIDSIGLVNIVAGKKIAPELLQSDLTPARLAREALNILKDEKSYAETSSELLKVKNLLGEPGASKKAAEIIIKHFQS
ncbi:MAG: lipid-A-disaccharide synthase [Candidatus Marinimicrobia bacterium]|nr:lipid-A-disaccharide synthase [Candidatus Neomarinimicrobiota bacterium]